MLSVAAAPIRFLDHDGDQVTVQLAGGGIVEVQGAVRNVELSGTGPSSVLTITPCNVRPAATGW